MGREELVRDAIKMLALTDAPILNIGTCYYYKRIVLDTKKGYENAFDTSTDIWRPLNENELSILTEKGFAVCNQYLLIKNAHFEMRDNRKSFQIATAKGNEKEKHHYFGKAMNALKKLRLLLAKQVGR